MKHLSYMNQGEFESTLTRLADTPVGVELGSVLEDDPEHTVVLAIGEMGGRDDGGVWIKLLPDGTWSAEPIAP